MKEEQRSEDLRKNRHPEGQRWCREWMSRYPKGRKTRKASALSVWAELVAGIKEAAWHEDAFRDAGVTASTFIRVVRVVTRVL